MKKAILRTLLYADLFDYPLEKKEIWKWLIWDAGSEKWEVGSLADSLEVLCNSKTISKVHNYYSLAGKERIIGLRRKRENWSASKIGKANKTAETLRKIPWIKLIGITGSLAVKNSDEQADIDLFFIVSENRLWLTRGLVVLILKIQGRYRQPDRINNMICPNMFISENNLEILPQNLFTAHEICQMVPLVDKDNTYSKFLAANSWVEDYLPNAYKRFARIEGRISTDDKISENQHINQCESVMESLAMRLQLFYMQKRRTKEIVSRNLIKFHPHDVGGDIMKKYQKMLKSI